jgi:uncharacterized membrane protein YfcA
MGHLFQFLAGAGSGLAGGVLSGMFGIGGGIVLVPLLALLLHLDQHRAQGVTLAAMLLPIGLPAVLHYRAEGHRIHWPLVGLIIVGFLVGVLAGSAAANLIPQRPLRYLFAAVLVLIALRSLGKGATDHEDAEVLRSLKELAGPALAIGFIGGASSGLLGIGGGAVIIPVLMGWLGFSQRQAQVTSLAVMLPPIGLPGVLVYAKAQGGLPLGILGGVVLGFLVGAGLGARVATRLSGSRLQGAFAALLLVMAVLLVLKA